MTIGISAIGTAVPSNRYSQKTIVEFLENILELAPIEKKRLKAIYRASGIQYRHTVLSDQDKLKGHYRFFPNHPTDSFPTTKERMALYRDNALPLAISAINDCFSSLASDTHSKIPNITHLITVSCTGMYAPGLDLEIINHFNFSSSTQRTMINFMGCYAAFNAIKVAEAICKSCPNAKVLVVCVELCSIHFQEKQDLDQMISSALFSDGAGAVLIETQIEPHTQRSKYLALSDFYCDILPQSEQMMAWSISDSGFDIVLSSYVPELIKTGIGTFLNTFLQKHQMTQQDLHYYAIHPGGAKILQACEQALGITEQDNRFSYDVLRDYGNMSSATILFVLKKIFHDLKPGTMSKAILSCAFGPGLTLESMLLKGVYV